MVKVQEEERRHLSRELHDQIGQALTAIGINPASDRTLEQPRGAVAHRGLPGNCSPHASSRCASLALDLRPSILDDLGLAAALRWLVDRQAQRAGLIGHFSDHSPGVPLHPDLATTCFRVVQEALTNVVRHARAQHIWVELQVGPCGGPTERPG